MGGLFASMREFCPFFPCNCVSRHGGFACEMDDEKNLPNLMMLILCFVRTKLHSIVDLIVILLHISPLAYCNMSRMREEFCNELSVVLNGLRPVQ